MIEEAVEAALGIPDKRERYEYVYDALCNYLDNEFSINNFCDFRDGKCAAVRDDVAGQFVKPSEAVGCCFSYEPGSGIHRAKVCKYLGDKMCKTKCLACKLYTCEFLREKGVNFNISDFPEIKRIFSRKQIEVLKNNLFSSREDIVDKLLKVKNNKMPYFLFRHLNLDRIK